MAVEAKNKKAVTAKAGIPPKIEKVSEELSCELTTPEWMERAKSLAEAHRFTEATKERKKAVMAELNSDLKIAEAKETKLSGIVASHSERRDVTVEVTYDYEKGAVSKRRTDTNELLSIRDMTTMERQGDLLESSIGADEFISEQREAERDELDA